MTFVVTGFQPFDGHARNVSADVLSLLPPSVAGVPTETRVLPVDALALPAALDALPADARAILHLGLAAERRVLSFERVGLNLLDFSRPDNGGNRLVDREVVPGAPLALPSRWPHRAVLAAWSAANIPAELSTSAGTFLCNQALYTSLHARPASTFVAFVHLPPAEHVPLARAAEAVRLALEALA